jgi:long-chain acyl-CoA synthetase
MVLDNGKRAIVRPLEDYLKASPAVDVCVVLCPAQTHLVAVEVDGEAVGRGA